MPDLSHTIVFAAVRGAVVNALHGHPDWAVPTNFARSVAKRAAGTLAGMNPGTALAAARRSGKRRSLAMRVTLAGALQDIGAHPLPFIKEFVEIRIVEAHKAGDVERFRALCDVARAIKHEIKREAADASA